MIPNGVQAIEFRSRTVDTNIAMKKGSIYVGTSANSTIGGNTVYAVETINPENNAVTGWIPNTVQLPIYSGSYGATGMAFAAAANIVVGRAEALGNVSSAYSVGGSAAGSGVGNAVYFSGGVPVALEKVANAVYADTAGSAASATTATKIGTGNIGNDNSPIWWKGGKPNVCATPHAALLDLSSETPSIIPGITGSVSMTVDWPGHKIARIKIVGNGETLEQEVMFYYHSGSTKFRETIFIPPASGTGESLLLAISTSSGLLTWKLSGADGYSVTKIRIYHLGVDPSSF